MSTPRQPRQSIVTPLQVALTLLIGLVLTGLTWFVALEVVALARFVGWLLWGPA